MHYMNNDTPLARPYAKAIFETTQDAVSPDRLDAALDSWRKVLAHLSDLIKTPEIRGLLDHPQVSKNCLEEILVLCTQDQHFTPMQQNFLRLLIQNRQLALLPNILKLLNERLLEKNPKIKIEIETALPVKIWSEDQDFGEFKNNLGKLLSEKLKLPSELSFSFHPELIGGIKIKTDHWVIDCSLQSQLKELAQQLIQPKPHSSKLRDLET